MVAMTMCCVGEQYFATEVAQSWAPKAPQETCDSFSHTESPDRCLVLTYLIEAKGLYILLQLQDSNETQVLQIWVKSICPHEW